MKKQVILGGLLLCSLITYGKSFEIISLGSNGGVIDGNLSAYFLREEKEENYIALDGGTIVPGIEKALMKGNLKVKNQDSQWSDTGYIYREKIKGYLISHGHLDHIAGMVISSTEDTKKNIYGSKNTIEVLVNSVFNWKLWPNFGDKGEGFKLNQYKYIETNSEDFLPIENTNYRVKSYPLSHSGDESTMFLVENSGNYIAYYGDVGPDKVEKSNKLEETFKVLGPLIEKKKLKGIMIEVSYDNSRSDNLLFGHLTPNWLQKEMEVLSKYSGGEKNLEGLNIIITHIKPSLKKDENFKEKIKVELQENNNYKINYFIPDQGDKIILK
ncbi:MAG: MBL fold metallo-hydrolase [Cetobacterium sp.]